MGISVPKPFLGGQRKLWSDWMDVPEVDQSLCWEHKSFYWFCHALAQLVSYGVPFYYLFPIYGYPKFIFGYDIHNSFLDIQKSIYGYPKIHFWISKNHLNIGYPLYSSIFGYPKIS